jgi:hypothetical protein
MRAPRRFYESEKFKEFPNIYLLNGCFENKTNNPSLKNEVCVDLFSKNFSKMKTYFYLTSFSSINSNT